MKIERNDVPDLRGPSKEGMEEKKRGGKFG